MQELVDRLNLDRLKKDARLQGNVTSPYHENGWVVTADRSGGLTEDFTRLPAKAQFFALHVNDLVNGGWNLEAFRVTNNGHLAIEAVFHSPDPPHFKEQVEEPTIEYVGRDLLRLRPLPSYRRTTRTRTNYFLDVKEALNPDLITAEPVAPEPQDMYTNHPTVFYAEPVSIPPFLALPDLMEMIGNSKAPIPKGVSRFYIRGIEFIAFPFQQVIITENSAELVRVWQNVPRLWTRILIQDSKPTIQAIIEKLPQEAEDKLNRFKELRRQVFNRAITPLNREIRRLTDSKENYSSLKVAAVQMRARRYLEAAEANIDPTHLLPQPE